MPLAHPTVGDPPFIDVIYTEEKGADVNLASYLLVDGFRREYEMAIVVSNDSDLSEPIRLVQCELGLPGTVVNPHLDRRRPSRQLQLVARSYVYLWSGSLKMRQFPMEFYDAHGVIRKPEGW